LGTIETVIMGKLADAPAEGAAVMAVVAPIAKQATVAPIQTSFRWLVLVCVNVLSSYAHASVRGGLFSPNPTSP
jgi:hypothetical protein